MNIIDVFLSELGVKHSRKFIEDNYLNTVSINNMLGVQRSLSRYGIETVGVHYYNKDDAGLTFPCILHLEDSFVVGIDFDGNRIKYYDGIDFENQDVSQFNEFWDGNALLVTNIKNAKEPDYLKNKFADIYADFVNNFLYFAVVALVLFFFLYNGIYGAKPICMLFDLLGFFICIMLFKKQVRVRSTIVNKVCSILQKNGCDHVLDSTGSKLFSIISWTEIGLTYFSSRIIFNCLYVNSLSLLQLIGWFAMGFGVWSIWYQAIKLKHWCTLCCLVQVIIWASGIFNLLIFKEMTVSCLDFAAYIICCFVVYVCIQILSNLCYFRDRFKETNVEYLNFRLDSNIFKTALSHSEEIMVGEESSIIYGNPGASTTLTVVTNPHCDSCAKTHETLMKLVENNPHVNVRYFYYSFSKKVEDSSLFCIAVYKQRAREEAVSILRRWYSYGRFIHEEFIAKYDVNLRAPEVLNEYAKHMSWIEQSRIHSTPTIIYDGYKLPQYYKIEDFSYIED